jgi:hypothetical protein
MWKADIISRMQELLLLGHYCSSDLEVLPGAMIRTHLAAVFLGT